MIEKLSIKNFKSIKDLELGLQTSKTEGDT